MNNNLNFESVKGYHLDLRKINDDQLKYLNENLIKEYKDIEGGDNLFHYGFSAPDNEYRFFSFTCFSLGDISEEISFVEYLNKLNTPKNDVYYNSEFNSESKIIGYKLIKEEYREVACKIAFSGREGDFFNLNRGINFKNNSVVHYNLKEAGVLHWFEPVFEEKKIKLTSGIELTEKDIDEVKEILNINYVYTQKEEHY